MYLLNKRLQCHGLGIKVNKQLNNSMCLYPFISVQIISIHVGYVRLRQRNESGNLVSLFHKFFYWSIVIPTLVENSYLYISRNWSILWFLLFLKVSCSPVTPIFIWKVRYSIHFNLYVQPELNFVWIKLCLKSASIINIATMKITYSSYYERKLCIMCYCQKQR